MTNEVGKFKDECGCSTGKYFMILGIFSFVAFIIYFKTCTQTEILENIIAFFYFMFCFAIIGKAIGLARSYLSFKKELNK